MVTETPKIRSAQESVTWAHGAQSAEQIKKLLDSALGMSNERVQVRLLEEYGNAIRSGDHALACEKFNAWRVVAEANNDSQARPIIAALAMMTFGAAL